MISKRRERDYTAVNVSSKVDVLISDIEKVLKDAEKKKEPAVKEEDDDDMNR
jgi:hypothetical protein